MLYNTKSCQTKQLKIYKNTFFYIFYQNTFQANPAGTFLEQGTCKKLNKNVRSLCVRACVRACVCVCVCVCVRERERELLDITFTVHRFGVSKKKIMQP